MADLNVYEVLNRKRRGAPLESREIEAFIERFTTGEIPDYQMSALLMAIAINGMTAPEMATLTQSMLRSGEQWHLRNRYDFVAQALDRRRWRQGFAGALPVGCRVR